MKIQTLWIIVMLGIVAGGVIVIDTKYVKHVDESMYTINILTKLEHREK